MLYPSIQIFCDALANEFDKIPVQRKQLLEKAAAYIAAKRKDGKPVQLIYICTHNSRRSHFGQLWAQVAGVYYKQQLTSFSGGTEATAFHRNAIQALKRIGFDIHPLTQTTNPIYHVQFDDEKEPFEYFSKVYDHPANPRSGFAAIMTCSEAETNCPFIPGAECRIAATYDDPKTADDKPLQDATYDERCRQIAREVFYTVSKSIS